MKLILFGGSGLVGSGVLREALKNPEIESVLSIGRSHCGIGHPKLREKLLPDMFDIAAVERELIGYDAAIWAVGISSVGMDEAAYAKVTEELTLAWARALLRLNPGIAFCYCSAAGAGGKSMWARVRQRVEGSLKEMPFRHAGAVRPAFIRPSRGIRSRTRLYQAGIVLLKPIFPLFSIFIRFFPWLFTTSEILSRAMLRVVCGQANTFILESKDINRIGA